MVDSERQSGFAGNPHSALNRAMGLLLLAYFSPIILLISTFILLRYGRAPVFGASLTPDTTLWQFNIAEEYGRSSRFLKQSRLHLLPQLANVARGEIPFSMALR